MYLIILCTLLFAVDRVSNVASTEDIDVERGSIVGGNRDNHHHQDHVD